jgi:hypothetical protein
MVLRTYTIIGTTLALTNRGLRNMVMYVRKRPSKDSTLDWKIF